VQAKLFWRLPVVFDDVRVCLRLGCSQLSPELDDLLAYNLDLVEALCVFFVYATELPVQLGDVGIRDVERGRDGGVRVCRRQLYLEEVGLEMGCVRVESIGDFYAWSAWVHVSVRAH
jgi:hypothetical protein